MAVTVSIWHRPPKITHLSLATPFCRLVDSGIVQLVVTSSRDSFISSTNRLQVLLVRKKAEQQEDCGGSRSGPNWWIHYDAFGRRNYFCNFILRAVLDTLFRDNGSVNDSAVITVIALKFENNIDVDLKNLSGCSRCLLFWKRYPDDDV